MTTIAPPRPPAQPDDLAPPFVLPAPRRRVWTSGATVSLLIGIVLTIGGAALLVGAGAIYALDHDGREGDYFTSDTSELSTGGYALTVEEIELDGLSGDRLFGEARVRVTPTEAGGSVFVGIASTDDAAAYLEGVQHAEIVEIDDSSPTYDDRAGGAPLPPAAVDIWTAQASGQGTQELVWTPSDGDWTVVAMNSDGTAAVHITADVGATVPLFETALRWFLVVGGFFAALGTTLVAVAIVRTRSRRALVRG